MSCRRDPRDRRLLPPPSLSAHPPVSWSLRLPLVTDSSNLSKSPKPSSVQNLHNITCILNTRNTCAPGICGGVNICSVSLEHQRKTKCLPGLEEQKSTWTDRRRPACCYPARRTDSDTPAAKCPGAARGCSLRYLPSPFCGNGPHGLPFQEGSLAGAGLGPSVCRHPLETQRWCPPREPGHPKAQTLP